MRLLHTADWHLGRQLHGKSLLDAQSQILDHLVELAADQKVDGILLAGDVYDRANPNVDAVRLADEALVRLAAVAPIVAISGNHDSAQRLGFASTLIARSGVHLRTTIAQVGEPIVIEAPGGGRVAIQAIPYLDPDLARGPLGVDERSHQAVVDAAMARVRASQVSGTPTVVVAHAFVAGGETSESEREIEVGGASSVSLSAFEGAAYVALGHLHRPHAPGERIRYCGSPLAYSFSEAAFPKSTTIVEIAGDGSVPRQELIAAPQPYKLSRLSGTIEDLLSDPRFEEFEGDWVEVTMTDADRPHLPMDRLRGRFDEVLVLRHEPPQRDDSARVKVSDRVNSRSDIEILTGFVADVRAREADAQEVQLLQAAIKSAGERE